MPGVVRTDMTAAWTPTSGAPSGPTRREVTDLLLALVSGELDAWSGRFVRAGIDTGGLAAGPRRGGPGARRPHPRPRPGRPRPPHLTDADVPRSAGRAVHRVKRLCIVMHMRRVAVAGASGYAGGEVLRLLLRPPRPRDRCPHRRVERRPAARRHPPAPDPAGRPGARGDHARGARRPRRRLPRPAARPLGGARGPAAATTWSSSTAAPTSGSPTRAPGTAVLRHRRTPGPGPTACPSCPPPRDRSATPSPAPRASPCRAATRPPSRLALAPGLAAGRASSPTTSWSSRPPAPRAPARSLKPHLLGAEVMGAMSPYGVGGMHRHTPEIEQNLTAAGGRPGHRLVHADAGADAARHPRHLHRPGAPRAPPPRPCAPPGSKAYADEPFVHLLPEGQWPQTGSVLGSNTVHLQVVARRAGRPGRRRRRGRQPHQGHRRRGRAVHQPRPGPARDHRPADRGGGAVSRMPLHLMEHARAGRRRPPARRRGARLRLDAGPVRLARPAPPTRPRSSALTAQRARRRPVRGPVHARSRSPGRSTSPPSGVFAEAARAAGGRRDLACSASRPTTPTGCSCPSTAAARRRRRLAPGRHSSSPATSLTGGTA